TVGDDINADLGLLAYDVCHGLGDTRCELGLVDALTAQAGAKEGPDALWTGYAADVCGEDTVGAGLHSRALRLLRLEPELSASLRWCPTAPLVCPYPTRAGGPCPAPAQVRRCASPYPGSPGGGWKVQRWPGKHST